MARLALCLLGPLHLTLDDQTVSGLAYDKVRALLAYLALEARPHRREALAELLWPEQQAAAARTSLRVALTSLRRALADQTALTPLLLISRETVQLNPASDYTLDVTTFSDLLRGTAQHAHPPATLCASCAARLREAVALYHGELLQQVVVRDSVAYDEWLTLSRERLHRQALDALAQLAAYHEARGEDEQARQYAWRTLALEGWDEAAHRCLMRVLARSGQRAAALAQYERCRKVLAEELGVEPAAETTALYEQIRAGPRGPEREVGAWVSRSPPASERAAGAAGAAPALPSATVTFLFTDIEGSTQLWEQHPTAMPAALARHDAILRQVIEAQQGAVVKTTGDGLHAVFATATQALAAALALQRALWAEQWEGTGSLRVRVALHTGVAEQRAADYFGPALNRVARLLAAGHGGQILLSRATQELVNDHLPAEVALRDLGTHRLKDLSRPEQIFQVMVPDLPADFPPLRTLDIYRHNLPTQATALIGRGRELAELGALLRRPEVRLVTLTGPGGIGKTRLAIALAEQLLAANRFPDGVFFVSLAPMEAVDSIVSALAEALEFPLDTGEQPARSPRQQVFDYLREKRLLVILDNIEHLLSGAEAPASDAADLIAALLGNAPGVVILATSRERLTLRAEQVYLLGGLDLPSTGAPTDSSAVDLFMQRARRLRPEFAPVRDQLDVVVRICRMVEGMPLAIELAAGWVDTLALPDIAAEIERGLDLLATELRDVPMRHHSMRAVFEASWRRLGAAEQVVFARLAVFRGGGTRHAVQAVTQATLPQLHALVRASLVHYDVAHERYTVHELLRQYAAEQLAADPTEEHATRDRHAAYFCWLLRDLQGDLQGARQLEALATIEADGENMRAAWEWVARQCNAALIDQAIDSLGYFYQWHGRAGEGAMAYRLAAAALANISGRDERRVRAHLLAWQAAYAQLLGERAMADTLLAQSQELLNDPDLVGSGVHAARAFVLLQAGRLAAEHDPPAARQVYEESQALFQTLGDHWGEAAVLFELGAVTLELIGDYDLAQRYLRDSLVLRRTLGDRMGIVETLTQLSMNARYRGEVAESERLARESYEISTTLANRRAIAIAGSNLGIALSWTGNYAEAQRLLQETVAIYMDLGDRAGLANAYYRLGVSEAWSGRLVDARATYERGLSISRAIGATLDAGGCLNGLAAIALAEGAYSEAQRLIAEAIAILDAVGERIYRTIASVNSALVERGLGNQQPARRQVITALRGLLEQRTWITMIDALATIALLLADDEDPERAVELYALTEREATPRHDTLTFAVCRRELAVVVAALPADVAAAAETRGRARDLWATAEELLAELEAAGWGSDEGKGSASAASAISSTSATSSRVPERASRNSTSSARAAGQSMPPEQAITEALESSTAPTSPAAMPQPPQPPPTNLPAPPTPLIGRERELAELGALLRRLEVRLITLTGAGGSGKTRLALKLAGVVQDAFPDGVFLVELAPVRQAELVAATIATILGLKDAGAQPLVERLTAHLHDRRLLLLLDNFEHVLDAAPLLATLLGACRSLKLLVTSRAPLRLRGEREVEVAPLAVPDLRQPANPDPRAQAAAVRLFVARVQDVRSDFRLTAENVASVNEICVRLDGLPLALELAARRVKVLFPQALLDRLRSRLQLLTGGAQDLPSRQQTMRATIDWSYTLLAPNVQALFARLGVCVDGCIIEAAEAIGSVYGEPDMAVLDRLQTLVDQSLLQRIEDPAGESRFLMLETIREYALEQLEASGEREAIRQRHAAYFLALAESAEPQLRGAAQVVWWQRLEQEFWRSIRVITLQRTAILKKA
jgi:predicted ATPase/DNA-binding SARP family transcriptional activator